MPQNNSSQQFGVGNMQMWQQQMVYKQLQELQRQQELQQVDQGARQQNLLSHASVTAKPAVANQFPLMMNEMPINNTSNFMWMNNFAGGVPTFSNNSQMPNTGNMDWTQSSGSLAMGNAAMPNVANSLMMSHEQGSVMRSMGFVPQQTDQSFYGIPVSSSRLYGNQYSQFLGMAGDSTDLVTDRVVNQSEKASEPFNSFQYNHSFPSVVPLHDRNSVNPQTIQGKSVSRSSPMEMENGDFQPANNNLQMSTPIRNSQSRQNFYSQEEPTIPVETSGSVATLDPTEQKILFGADEDDGWGTSFSGSLGIGTGGYEHGSSLENGSFGGFPSIQSGSWSALMQEAVQASSSEKGIQEEWSGLTLQTMEQSGLKNSVVSDDNGKQLAAWGDNHRAVSTSLASRSLPLFNDAGSSLRPNNATLFQHSFVSTGGDGKKMQNEDLNMSYGLPSGNDTGKQFNQGQKHKQVFEGDRQVQTSLPNGTWAAQSYQQQSGISTDMLNVQGGWSHHQNMSSSSVPRSTSNFYDNSGNIWGDGQNVGSSNSELQSRKPNVGGPEMKTEDAVGNFGSIMSSTTTRMNQNVNQHAPDSRQMIFGTNFSLNSSMNNKDESFFIHGNEKSGNETSQMAISNKLVHNPFSNNGSNPQVSLPLNRQSNIPGFSNSRSDDQGHLGKFNSTGHVQNASLLKGVGMDVVERNTNSVDASGSFAGSAAHYLQNSKNAYSSQNMLELFHKADQSKSSVVGTASDATVVASESSHPNQPKIMQGYGLRLAPPTQLQSSSNQGLPHTHDNCRQLNKEIDNKEQAGSDAALPVKCYKNEACLRDNLDTISDVSNEKDMVTQDIVRPYISTPPMLSKVPCVGTQAEDQNQKLRHYDIGTRSHVEPQQKSMHNLNSSRLAFSSAGVASANTNAVTDSGFYSADGGARSGLKPSVSSISQQPGSSKMLHNVWAKMSAQQRLAGMQSQKVSPQLLQSIINSSKGASLRGLLKEDDQVNRGENVSPETGASPGNSQNEDNEIREEPLTVTRSEKVATVSRRGNTTHLQGTDHPHQQDVRSKMGEDPFVRAQQMNVPSTASSSSSHVGVSQHTLLTSSSQHQNYSLLHQMQARKDGDSDSSQLLGKRLRSADLGCSAPPDWNAGQGFVYGQNAPSSVPSEGKDEEENANATAGRHTGLPDQIHSLTPSSSNLIGGIERSQISTQKTPVWFEKYRNDKNGLLVSSCDVQKFTNAATHPYFLSRISGSMENSGMVEKTTESGHEGTAKRGTLVPTISANESSQCSALPSGSNQGLVIRPKKRKPATLDLLPWRKVVVSDPRSFQSISMPEQEWAQATNRLVEQMDNEADNVNYAPSTSQPQKRLILTTKLLQNLLPAISYKMLKVDAADGYQSLTFCVAKSALADACGLIHSPVSSVSVDQNNAIPPKRKTYARMEENMLLKVAENFIDRSKKLENDLQRLDSRTSLLDVRLECLEIEKFSIVNRLGKFHGRPQSEGAETSSASEAAIRRTFPQRYVTAISAPGKLPESVPCLSL